MIGLNSQTLRQQGLVVAAAFAALLIAVDAQAQWRFDESLLPMLPPYCRYTQLYSAVAPGGRDPVESGRWSKSMGRANFIHMHHYCWGLERTYRSLYRDRTKRDRLHNLTSSIREFDYVIARVSPNFALLPEIHTKKGENLLRLEQAPLAIPEFERAIELKPDYWPPYATLSDYYKKAGDVVQARKWLEKGLAASPDTPALKRRLGELDAASRKRTGKQ